MNLDSKLHCNEERICVTFDVASFSRKIRGQKQKQNEEKDLVGLRFISEVPGPVSCLDRETDHVPLEHHLYHFSFSPDQRLANNTLQTSH